MHCRYQLTADATKAMQQLDGMEIAGIQISVKVAPLTPAETQAAAAAAAGLDLDDDEGIVRCPQILSCEV